MIEIDDKAIQQYVYFPQNSNVEADSYSLVLHSELTQLDIEFNGLTDESKSKNYFKFLIDASQVDDGEFNYSIKANGNIVATGLIKIGKVTDDIPETHEYDSSIEEDEVIQYYPTGNYKYRFQSNKIVEITSNGIYNVKPDSGYTALLNVEVHADIIPNKQIKDIEIVENSTVKVTADEGYDALSEVNVTVDVPVEDYYQSGYTSGYTDGFNTGYTSGCTDGYQEGYGDGVAEQKSKLVSTAITTNGTYEREDGYNKITVNVPTGSTINNQTKSVTATTNGTSAITFDAGYTGLDRVNVNVNVPVQDYWNSGYTSGKTDGVAEQKAKLISTAITANGTYQKEDGYNQITVNVPTGSTINNQTKTVNVNVNGTSAITYDVGYTGLERVNLNVNIPQTGHTDEELAQAYTSGITVGVAEQKSKLVSTAVTTNGTYTRSDGYNTITVNVPTQDYWNSGYTSGYTDGYAAASGGQIQYYNVTVSPSASDGSSLVNKVQVTFTYGSSSDTITYQGTPIVKQVIPGVSYTVSFNNVSGYVKPGDITGNSTWGGSTSYSPIYTASGPTPPTPYQTQYLTFDIISGGELSKPNNYSLEYSVNDSEWVSMGSSIVLSSGDKVRMKGERVGVTTSNNSFSGSVIYNVYGNILSIIYADNFVNYSVLPDSINGGYFRGLFTLTNVISAENLVLPSNTTSSCYQEMFGGCTSLTTAPSVLPASTLAANCYNGMFYNCTGLTTAPIISATGFSGTYSCQYMFYGCSSLTTAPELPATTISGSCYNGMFERCTSLTTAPELPATTLASGCYNSMFKGCTSLITAPELPASILEQGCYNSMFNGCTSLNYIKCLATDISANNCTSLWTINVSSTGTFVKKSGVTWTTDIDGIPSGWTVEEV